MHDRHWKKIDRVGVEEFPYYLDDNDECYFARDYLPGRGYAASESNDLINNFKKPIDRKGRPEWRYKVLAIERFAYELSMALPDDFDGIVTCIPSSTRKDDPQYDSKLDETLSILKRLKPNIQIEYPISIASSVIPSHLGGQKRRPEVIYANLNWEGLRGNSDVILLVDDVITTGAHFKACQKIIKENCPQIRVIGLFWAKAKWVE